MTCGSLPMKESGFIKGGRVDGSDKVDDLIARDLIAIVAMHGLVSRGAAMTTVNLAKEAYFLADAMLGERE
jgi:hypothetical protein